MTELTFTQSGDNYVSEVITATGNTLFEIAFDGTARVTIEQSITGDNWEVAGFGDFHNKFVRTTLAVVAGSKLKVTCTKNPTAAYYV